MDWKRIAKKLMFLPLGIILFLVAVSTAARDGGADGFLRFRYPVGKIDCQLGMDHAPVLAPSGPFSCNVHHGQIQHLQQAVVGGKNGLGFRHLPKLAVEALNGVGGVNQPADLLGELEVGA